MAIRQSHGPTRYSCSRRSRCRRPRPQTTSEPPAATQAAAPQPTAGYFSESSGLLVRRGDQIDTPLGAVPERYDFSGFERVDGVMVPKIVWSRADYQVTHAVIQIGHDVTAR